MKPVLLIARLTLQEATRRELYVITLFLALLIMFVPIAVNVFGLGASERIVKDVVLTIIGLYSVALAVLLGATVVPSDIERRTAFPILARPITRRSYLWGKWLGLMGFIVLSAGFLACCALAASLAFLERVDPRLLLGAWFYVLEACVLSAACIFFSTMASPALAAVLGVFIYIVGGLSHTFVAFFLQSGDGGQLPAIVARALKSCLPNFELFHIKNAIVHGDPIAASFLLAVALYGIGWTILFQVLADFWFTRRDL